MATDTQVEDGLSSRKSKGTWFSVSLTVPLMGRVLIQTTFVLQKICTVVERVKHKRDCFYIKLDNQEHPIKRVPLQFYRKNDGCSRTVSMRALTERCSNIILLL